MRRVIQFSTGNVGRHALRTIIGRPDLELVGVHANGDVTIDMVLKAYERALQKWPDANRRHRIEHARGQWWQ